MEEGVEDLQQLAFNNCSSLRSIVLPKSIVSIGSRVCKNGTSLSDIYYGGTKFDWAKIKFSYNDEFSGVTIHYTEKQKYVGNIVSRTINLAATDENGTPISISINMVDGVTYNNKKHISSLGVAKKNTTNDVIITVSDNGLSSLGTLVFKYKNNKIEPQNESKRPSVVLSYKPKKGLEKDKKLILKMVNKELKKKPLNFDILPADLELASDISVVYDKENDKVKSVKVTIDGQVLKLNKSDYSIVVKDNMATLTGRRNYSGKVVVTVKTITK